MQGQQIKRLAVSMMLMVATPWITARPTMAAAPFAAELILETQHLADLVRECDEDAGPTAPPIMVSTNCDYPRQWWYERCEHEKALVPFTTSGPEDAVWNYVALLQFLPKEAEMDAEIRRDYHRRPKHVALVTFAFVSKPLA